MRRAQRSWLPFVAAALAVVMLPSLATPTDAATSNWTSKCDVRVRTAPKVTSTTLRIIDTGAVVTATATVTGGSYRADCPSTVTGTNWLKVVAINGKSTTSLFDRSAVYVAAKLFKSGPNPTATPKPNPHPRADPDRNPLDHGLPRELRRPAALFIDLSTTRAIIDTNTVVTASAR